MSKFGTYNFVGTKNFVIENNIIKGMELPSKITHNSYGELILEAMRANPNFVGQIDGLTGREETFAEMMEKSVKCAMWLKKVNIQPNDVIGICTHNQPDMYVPCFASLYVGAIFNAWWDDGLTKEMATYFVNLTRPKVLFANEASAHIALEVAEELGAEIKIVVFGKLPGLRSLDDILAAEDSNIVPEFCCTKLNSIDHPAVIMYTSGSTGLPKGVQHSHRSLFENVINFGTLNDELKSETTMLFSPLSWISGVFVMLKGAVKPDTRIIYPGFVEESAFRLIEKFKVNWMLLGISTAFRLQQSPAKSNYDLSSVQSIVVGGSTLIEDRQKALVEMFPNATICQAYGSTELGLPGVQQEINFKSGSCGRVIRYVSLKVADPDTGEALGPNQIGEACFKSPYMMTCYYGNPEATRETIDAEGWLHTGDLIRYDEEGHIFFVDRMKDIIKYRGHHVSPVMIEKVLQSHPEVLEAAVLSIPHDVDDEHPIAFVVKIPNATVTEEDLKKLVSDVLPNYMNLRGGVRFLDELPHTTTGKVSRPELRNLTKSYVSWFTGGISYILRLHKSPSIPNYDLSSLKFILVGGAALPDESQKAVAKSFPHADLRQAYGSTEVGALGVQQMVNSKPGSCCRVSKNFMMEAIDPDSGKILGPNTTGEGCFKYPFMMTCYYRNPEATSKAIDSERRLHTGDLLKYDEEGYVFFVDRKNELIKYRGNHVSLRMIERTILLHPEVRKVAVVAIPYDLDDENPIAFIAKIPNAKVTKGEVQKLVADTLPDYMKLRGGVQFLDELPHTASGKINRPELKKILESYVR